MITKIDEAFLAMGDGIVAAGWDRLGWKRLETLRAATAILVGVCFVAGYVDGKSVADVAVTVLLILITYGLETFISQAHGRAHNVNRDTPFGRGLRLMALGFTAICAAQSVVVGQLGSMAYFATILPWWAVNWSIEPNRPRRRRESRALRTTWAPAS